VSTSAGLIVEVVLNFSRGGPLRQRPRPRACRRSLVGEHMPNPPTSIPKIHPTTTTASRALRAIGAACLFVALATGGCDEPAEPLVEANAANGLQRLEGRPAQVAL